METININGVEYVAKSEYDKATAGKKAMILDGMEVEEWKLKD